MRVIAGTLRGKKLNTFSGKLIRPTSDRTREAVFNILANRVSGARVLDLFAGSGAFGIEALSRGADGATFVDKAPAAISLLKQNLRSCRLETKSRVFLWDIERNLNCLTSANITCDLVFLDPPYHCGLVRPTLTHLANSRVMTPGTCLVLEHGHNETLSLPLTDFDLMDQRRYGKTLVSFLAYMI